MSGNNCDSTVGQETNKEFEELIRQLKQLESFCLGTLSSSKSEPSSSILNQYFDFTRALVARRFGDPNTEKLSNTMKADLIEPKTRQTNGV